MAVCTPACSPASAKIVPMCAQALEQIRVSDRTHGWPASAGAALSCLILGASCPRVMATTRPLINSPTSNMSDLSSRDHRGAELPAPRWVHRRLAHARRITSPLRCGRGLHDWPAGLGQDEVHDRRRLVDDYVG